MNAAKKFLSSIGRAIGALFIITIVLVVPLLSFVEVGHVFRGGAKRSAEPLAAMQTRSVDAGQDAPQLFEEPLISVTFDDGHETTYSVAMPLLQKHGIPTTQYLLSGTANDPKYVSWEQMRQMQIAGHEIACHTITHADLTTLDDTKLHYELTSCKQELEGRFGPIHNFASPYGAQDARTLAAIGKYYGSQRNTLGDPRNGVDAHDVNLPRGFDRMNIIAVTVRSDTSLQHIQELVDYTKKNNGWLVLTYHQANDPTSIYALDEKAFDEQFAYLSGTDVRIVTVQEALASQRR